MRPVRATPAPRTVSFRLRLGFAFGLLALAGAGLVVRAVQLQLVQHTQLAQRGQRSSQYVSTIPAHRGMVTDRNGEPLAISTPVDSVKLTPRDFDGDAESIRRLATALKVQPRTLANSIADGQGRPFMYLARGLEPALARTIDDMDIAGVSLEHRYRRFYPSGEVTLHLLGYTNVEDEGRGGVEQAWDTPLAGEDGRKRVLQTAKGERVDVESLKSVLPGADVHLSIDQRLQYLAYRELKSAVLANHARGGSLVMVDVDTGEVLAMVNQPSSNPNDREHFDVEAARNNSVVETFEPGSSIKPFFVAAGMAAGRYSADSVIDTGPGFIKINATTTFHDEHVLGAIPLSVVLAKSSNVGMAILALHLEPRQIYSVLSGVGLGRNTQSYLPAEAAGTLQDYRRWHTVDIATMSHGYHLSVTTLQLAQAYATLGAMGVHRPASLLRVDGPVAGERVLDPAICASLLHLLESVASTDGTAPLARIAGYHVAGKTGTAWKAGEEGYSANHRYRGIFAGVAPVSHPRFAMAIVIDEPTAGKFMGGDVAAPVFSAVMGGALRLMGVPPDDVPAGSDALRLGTQVAAR